MLYELDQLSVADLASSPTAQAVPLAYDVTDEDLMARIQARDQDALQTLFRRHGALLRTIVLRIVNNDEDTSDGVQDVLLEIWKRAESFDSAKGKALGWIVTMARRRAIDRVRRRQAYNRAEERNRLEVESQAPSFETGADEEAQNTDRAETIKRVLATLPDAQREALEFTFYRGLSQREIAAKTGVALGTIKTRIELGVRKVRGAILALGGAREWSSVHA